MDLLKTIHDERPNWVSDFIREDVYGKSTCLGEAEEIGGAKNPQQAIEVKWHKILNKFRFKDLHADGRNVAEDPINEIHLSLKKVVEHIPEEVTTAIAEQLK